MRIKPATLREVRNPIEPHLVTLTGTLDAANEIGVRFTLSPDGFRLFAQPPGGITEPVRHMVKLIRPRLILRLHLQRVMPDELAAFDEHFAVVTTEAKRSADRIARTKRLDASTLACWFWYHAQHLPRAPFKLTSGEHAGDPLRLYQTIADRLLSLPWGLTLRAELDRLSTLYDLFGMDTLEAEREGRTPAKPRPPAPKAVSPLRLVGSTQHNPRGAA